MIYRGIDPPTPIGFCIEYLIDILNYNFVKKCRNVKCHVIIKYNCIKCISIHHNIIMIGKKFDCINEIEIRKIQLIKPRFK